MEITLNFQLTTLILGAILGILFSGLIGLFLLYKRKQRNVDEVVVIPKPVPQMWIEPTVKKVLPKPKIKYQSSSLQAMEKAKLLTQLFIQMEEQKVYQQPNLTLAALAEKMNVPKNYLSQIINEKMGCNFLEFLNQYRVKAARAKLESADYQHLSILEIGRQSGFNSKTTYYAVFKKHMNTSPGNYRRAIAS